MVFTIVGLYCEVIDRADTNVVKGEPIRNIDYARVMLAVPV